MSEHRVVVVDGHIIAQFNSVGWWTCSKANNNNEEDFAVWQFSQAGMEPQEPWKGNVSED